MSGTITSSAKGLTFTTTTCLKAEERDGWRNVLRCPACYSTDMMSKTKHEDGAKTYEMFCFGCMELQDHAVNEHSPVGIMLIMDERNK